MASIAVVGFAAIFVVCCSAQEPNMELIQHFQGIMDECIKETDVDKALVEKMLKNKEYTDDDNFKCFFKCVYIKGGSMSEDGELNVEVLKQTTTSFLGEARSAKVVEKCSGLKGSDACETAFIIDKCMFSN